MSGEEPYWKQRPGVAPVKAEFVPRIDGMVPFEQKIRFVRWDLVSKTPDDLPDDDAAEGGGRPSKRVKLDAAAEPKGPSKKAKRAQKLSRDAAHLCVSASREYECLKANCKFSHDAAAYLRSKPPALRLPTLADCQSFSLASFDPALHEVRCHVYDQFGICFQGLKCRFLASHSVKTDEKPGFCLLFDEPKMRQAASVVVTDQDVSAMTLEELKRFMYNCKGELNYVMTDVQRMFRGKREDSFPRTTQYFKLIGLPWQNQDDESRQAWGRKGKKGKQAVASKPSEPVAPTATPKQETTTQDKEAATTECSETRVVAPSPSVAAETEKEETAAATSAEEKPPIDPQQAIPSEPTGQNDSLKNSSKPDFEKITLREKKTIDFKHKMYLGPLTTNGNLPFRRLCVNYGAEITVSEMAVATELLSGNPSEWSLVRRHPSEKTFGVQLAGSRPAQLAPCVEALSRSCSSIDFVDLNTGCPIDLICKKGAGSALLDHGGKMGQCLMSMSQVLGPTPVTVKMRTGIRAEQTSHNIMLKAIKEPWNISAITLHGRSKQQRYSKLADQEYIAQCVRKVRQTEQEQNLPRTSFIGNGDAYDPVEFWNTIEKTGVDTIMVARGALIKPWIFTELKERRLWDISAQERLESIGTFAKYGLEHWGSDSQGINLTRRFLLEALSFQHRYVPVGLLETFPVTMNHRPFPFFGRNDLETLLASPKADDWQKIAAFFLGPPPEDFVFVPKHKSNAGGGEAEG